MDEQREQDYLNLINQLINCPDGEEITIIKTNQTLIDAGLFEMMNQVAVQLTEQENNNGKWLQNFSKRIACSVYNQSLPDIKYFDFVIESQKVIIDGSTQSQIYRFFEENLDAIDDELVNALQIWSDRNTLDMESKGIYIAGYTMYTLAYSFEHSPLENLRSKLEIALAGYNIALKIFAKVNKPLDVAKTYINLASVYRDRIEGTKKNNIEQAIAAYNNALQICTKEDFPVDWADTQHNLALSYKERIKGDKRENIELAINHYQAALEIYTQQEFSEEWAMIQYNVALSYKERIKGDKADNIENAIAACEKALIIYTQKDFPVQWAMAQNNLGLAYKDRIKGDKADNIENSIAACEKALIIYTQKEFPEQWAMTQSNLGLAYKDRIKGDKADNIENSIAAYEKALTIYTQQEFPVQWATTQNNLGVAYENRIKGDKAQNVEAAIAACEKALTIYTQQEFPLEWAGTQNSLGNACIDRIKGDKADNLELALAAYEKALTIYTQQDFPVQWAMTQSNLGNACIDRIKGHKADNIENAIAAYEKALTIYTQQDFPVQWADTQSNLGGAYGSRIKGDKADNLEQAIAYSQQALIVRTQQDCPVQWAATQNNLGNVYNDRIRGDKAQNIELAIAAYKQALIIYTPQTDPINCLRAARNLSNLHFVRGNWQQAIEAYSLAIEAVEQSREWAYNEQNKQEIISNAIEVYQNIVQAYINLGQIDKAIEYVERGKARNLVDLLATRDLYPNGDIPQAILDSLDKLRRNITIEQKRLSQIRSSYKNNVGNSSPEDARSVSAESKQNFDRDREQLNSLSKSLDFLIKTHIQPVDPSFELTQIKPISFSKIKSTLPTEQTAIIEWFIGNGTLSAFIVTSGQDAPIHIDYSEEQFSALVDCVSEYYGSYRQRDKQWDTNLPQLLDSIAQHLQLSTIVEQVKQILPNCNQIILVPHRWLHLLPIHALPLSDGQCLLDLFPKGVSYAPSAQLLELTQKQSKPSLTNLFAVQDPTEDLTFTNLEVTAIRSQFTPNDDVLIGKEATRQVLTRERLAEANSAHFSCHGYFNFENPELSALLMAGSKLKSATEAETENENKKQERRYLPSREGGSIDLEKCLTLGEIFSLDLRNCCLVTLSACETGLTDFTSLSDEYIGLPSGFLFAGSPSVVSSLWTVSDLSTTFLMIKFYQNLAEMASVPVALNQAQLWLRDVTRQGLEKWQETLDLPRTQMYKIKKFIGSISPNTCPFASPYHWAAFCAVGS